MIKNKKRGFTLAEILITLGVIGVIAALTIPQIVDYTMKAKIEGNLARAVEQIELGLQNTIQKANDNSLDGSLIEEYTVITQDMLFKNGEDANITISSWLNSYGQSFWNGKPIDLTSEEKTKLLHSGSSIIKVKNFDGTTNASIIDGIKGAAIIYGGEFTQFTASIGSYPFDWGGANCTTRCASIVIDANGFRNKPNTYGKDVFIFDLTSRGKLNPNGNKDNCVKGNVGKGFECAARVVADGFKINYW